jgi:hypothetical protein
VNQAHKQNKIRSEIMPTKYKKDKPQNHKKILKSKIRSHQKHAHT